MIARLMIRTPPTHRWLESAKLSNSTTLVLLRSRANSYRSCFRTYSSGAGTQSSDASHTRRLAIAALFTLGVVGCYALRKGVFPDRNLLTTNNGSPIHESHTPKAAPELDSDLYAVLNGSHESNVTLTATYGTPDDVLKAIEELRLAFPDKYRVSTDPNVLTLHGSSENSYHPSSSHSVVVQAKSTEDVVKIVNISRKYRIPIIPYSGATSLEGHFSGVGLVLHASHYLT